MLLLGGKNPQWMRDEMEAINGKADAAKKNRAKAIANLQEVEMSVEQAKDALASATANGDTAAAKTAQKWLNTSQAEVKEVTRAVASFEQAEAALNVAKQVLTAAAGPYNHTYHYFSVSLFQPPFGLLVLLSVCQNGTTLFRLV